MSLDISNNMLTDQSIKAFADLLCKFKGLYSVIMCNMMRMKDQTVSQIANALSESSVGFLDIRGNCINENNLSELLGSLEENWVL